MIPKVIHRIWVEGSPILPEVFADIGKQWVEMHPDWEVKDWTMPPWTLRNQDAWDEAPPEDRLRWRSDVLRLELLLAYGGVYVDMDVVPLAPLDSLVAGTGAVAGYSPDHWKGQRVITNAVLAVEPGHSWIQRCVDRLSDSIDRYKGSFTAMVTGPHHVNRCLKASDDVTVLPAEFLYPRTRKEKLSAFTYHMWANRRGVSLP